MLIITLVSGISSIIKSTSRYISFLLNTNGRKTCTQMARENKERHDTVQRDLEQASEHPEYLRQLLMQTAIEKAAQMKGKKALIVDNTLIRKEHAKNIEGVSFQHTTKNEKKPGINVTAAVLTDMENPVVAVDLFIWQRGDASKIKKAVDFAIKNAQRLGINLLLADAAYAIKDMIAACIQASLTFVFRVPCTRAVSLTPDGKPIALRNHPAFKFEKNTHTIIKEVYWHGHKVRAIALKLKNKSGKYTIMYLFTNASLEEAKEHAAYYRKRWGVEPFFRTVKQDGLQQCQARSMKKQKAHYLSVFCAYNEKLPKEPLKPMKKKLRIKKIRIPMQKLPISKTRRPYKSKVLALA